MSFPFVQPYFGLGNSLQTAQGGSGAVGGWKELARTTLGSAVDTINVTGLADKRYLMILKSFGGSTSGHDRFNGDSGSNYSSRYGVSGSSDYTNINKTAYPWNNAGYSTTPNLIIDYVSNLASKEKLVHRDWIYQYTAGASNPPRRAETIAKWTNTSDSISSTSMYSSASNYDSGSELIVLGWDPADTHTTNFWEELATNTASGGGSTQEVTFTAKKYLWFQCYFELSGSTDIPRFQVGNGSFDTGNNYAERFSGNGGADETQTSRSDIHIDKASSNPFFVNGFIINNASQEKLFTIHSIEQGAAGASTAPTRIENVGKWSNTSNQIDRLRTTFGTDTINAGSIIKVWGSD